MLKSSRKLEKLFCAEDICGFRENLISDGNLIEVVSEPAFQVIQAPGLTKAWLEFGLVDIKVGDSGACIIHSVNDTHIVCQVGENVGKQGAITVSIGNLCVSIGKFRIHE